MMPLDLQHDFPHVVRLYYNAACLPEQFSGSGILLGSRHILTCAHVAEELEKHSRALTWFAREPDGTIVKVIKGTFTDADERAANLTLVDLAVFELDSKDVEGRTRQPPGKPLTCLKRVTYPFLKTTLEVSEIVAAGGVELGIDPYGVLIKPPRADRDGAPVNFQCSGGIASGWDRSGKRHQFRSDGGSHLEVGYVRVFSALSFEAALSICFLPLLPSFSSPFLFS